MCSMRGLNRQCVTMDSTQSVYTVPTGAAGRSTTPGLMPPGMRSAHALLRCCQFATYPVHVGIGGSERPMAACDLNAVRGRAGDACVENVSVHGVNTPGFPHVTPGIIQISVHSLGGLVQMQRRVPHCFKQFMHACAAFSRFQHIRVLRCACSPCRRRRRTLVGLAATSFTRTIWQVHPSSRRIRGTRAPPRTKVCLPHAQLPVRNFTASSAWRWGSTGCPCVTLSLVVLTVWWPRMARCAPVVLTPSLLIMTRHVVARRCESQTDSHHVRLDIDDRVTRWLASTPIRATLP